MSIKYTPILRWKAGEKNCLENLSPDISSQIIPFVEVSSPPVSPTDNETTIGKKMTRLFSSFNTSWENKPFYLYLSDNWYSDADSPEQISEIYANQGPTLKRVRPRAQGRAFRIRKRTSHITIVVKELGQE